MTSPAIRLEDRSLLVHLTTPVPTNCHPKPTSPRDPTSTSCTLPRPSPHQGNYKTLALPPPSPFFPSLISLMISVPCLLALNRTSKGSPPGDPGSASLPDHAVRNRGTTRADDATSRPTVDDATVISPGDRIIQVTPGSLLTAKTPPTGTRTYPVTAVVTLTSW